MPSGAGQGAPRDSERVVAVDAGAVRALLRLVRQEKSAMAIGSTMVAEEPISPQRARAIQVSANVMRAAIEKYGLLGPTEAGVLMGYAESSGRNAVKRRHDDGELLAIETRRGFKYPGFQFKDGQPIPLIRRLREEAHERGWSEYDLFAWMVEPEPYLHDESIPADIVSDQARWDDIERVLDLELSANEW